MKKQIETAATPDALLKDLQALVAEAEKIVANSGGEDSDTATSLRDRFEAAQERFGELYDVARKRIVAGAKGTDQLIRANPYQSLAIALGAGLLLGVVLGRRK